MVKGRPGLSGPVKGPPETPLPQSHWEISELSELIHKRVCFFGSSNFSKRHFFKIEKVFLKIIISELQKTLFDNSITRRARDRTVVV